MRPLTANAEHADGGLVQLNEHAIVDLAKSEKLEHLSDLGRDLVDTTDPHDESQLGQLLLLRFTCNKNRSSISYQWQLSFTTRLSATKVFQIYSSQCNYLELDEVD